MTNLKWLVRKFQKSQNDSPLEQQQTTYLQTVNLKKIYLKRKSEELQSVIFNFFYSTRPANSTKTPSTTTTHSSRIRTTRCKIKNKLVISDGY